MRLRAVLCAGLLALWALGASAQVPVTGAGRAGPAAATYVGPLDIVSGATAIYALRAASAAIAAAGTQKIVDLRRASDNATCTAIVATSGGVDLTVGTPCNGSTQTVTAWLNNGSSCTGSITTTVLTIASCTAGNLAVGLPISGSGVTALTYITALGTGTGGAGTYTVNISQTAVSETITAPIWAFIPTVYDQSGNGFDITQGTAGNQPKLVFSCLGSLPCFSLPGSPVTIGNTTVTNLSQPYTRSLVYLVFVFVSNTRLVDGIGANASPIISGNGAANRAGIFAGAGPLNATATDGVWHAVQGVFNSSSSGVNVDGTTSSGNAGTAQTGTSAGINFGSGDGIFSKISAGEMGLWPVGFTSTQLTNMCHNQFLYWGTPTSC